MRDFLIFAVVLVLFVGAAVGQQNKPEQVITEPKPLYRETTIVAEGRPKAAIVVPDTDEYRTLGERVQSGVREVSGAELPVVADNDVNIENPSQHLILIGNMDTNAAVEWLYWRRYVACDLDYPGPEGYVVRTACDPWGKGINAIMLGGSDLAGVRAAVEAFADHLQPGDTLTLPMLRDIHIRNLDSIDEAALEEDWEYYRQEVIQADSLWYQVEKKIFRLAYDYYLTGIDEYAGMYQAVIRRWMDEYYRYTPNRQLVTPKYQMPDMFRAFDLVEESPAISDEIRLEMTNLLLDYAIRMGQCGRVHNWKPGEMRLTGHIPLLSVVYGYQYFTKYYPDTPMELLHEGMDDVRVAMDSYTNSVGFMSETGYLCYHPELITYYSQATGDRRWYESGNALDWEKYHLLVTDNRGTALGRWTPMHMMAAREYEDGRWVWLSNFQRGDDYYRARVSEGKLQWPRWLGRPDLEPVVPEGLAGLRVFHMTEKWHRSLEKKRGELGVSADRAFNQMAMRNGYDRSGQYMRIPGVNVGFHYGTPANAVMSLYDRGRQWLVNGRWGRSLPKYYNTMLIVKDGQTYTDLPYLCRLHTATDLPEAGFFQSELPAYTGTNWMRSVIWNRGRYWLVFDSVTARQEADYTAVCQWRVGRNSPPQLSDGRAVVEGSGQALMIETPESPRRAVAPEGPAFGDTSSYMYRQSQTDRLAPGEAMDFANLLWVKGGSSKIAHWTRWQSSGETAMLVEAAHSGDSALKLINTGESWQCLNQSLEDLEPGKSYRVTGWARTNGELGAVIQIRNMAAEKSTINEARTDAQEWTKLEFEFQAPPESGKPELWLQHHHYDAPEGIAWFDDLSVVPADGGDNLLGNPEFEDGTESRRPDAEYAVRGLQDGCVIVSGGSRYWISGACGGGETRQFDPAANISVTARAFQIGGGTVDLTGATAFDCNDINLRSDKTVDISLNTVSGKGLIRTDEPANVSVEGIGTITVGELEMSNNLSTRIPAGEWEFAFEADTEQVIPDAEAIWEKARKPGAKQDTPRPGQPLSLVARASGQAKVNATATADLDGDGATETVAGLEDGSTIAVDADGSELFRHAAGGAINALHCVDLTGDGTPNILAASDDYNLYALNAAGQTLWEFSSEGKEITTKLAGNMGTGRYVSSEGEFIAIETSDIDGDGTTEILAGAKTFEHGGRHVYGTLWVLAPDGQLLWHVFNFGGTVDSIDAADIDGDGEKEIAMGTGGGTYGKRVYVVQPGGEEIAEIGGPYGEKRVAFAQLQEGADLRLVRMERSNGQVDVFSPDGGKPVWTYPTSGLTSVGPFVADFDDDGLDEICLAGASGDVYMLQGGDSHLQWRTNVGGPISCLHVAEVDGSPTIAVGTYDGAIVMLDASGSIVAHAALSAAVNSIQITESGTMPAGLEDGKIVMLQR